MNMVLYVRRSLYLSPPTCKQRELPVYKEELFLVENKGWIKSEFHREESTAIQNYS